VKEEAQKRGTLPVPAAENPVAPAKVPSLPGGIAKKRAEKVLTSWRSRTASRLIPAVSAPHTAQPIAVIGMAGQFPQAKNPEEFWLNIAQGKNCVTPVPPTAGM